MTGPRAGSIDSIRLQSLQPGLWSRGTMIDLWTNKLAQLSLDILILGGMSDSSSNWLMDSILEIICVIALMAVNLAESKGLIDHSMIIGNLVHTYLAGLIAVFNCWSRSSRSNGLIIASAFVYNLVSRTQLFLVLLSMLELISSMFRTLTLPNRLSVNLFAGIMIVNVVSINISNFSIIAMSMGLIGLVIMIYELFNLILQMFILNLLTMDYDSCI